MSNMSKRTSYQIGSSCERIVISALKAHRRNKKASMLPYIYQIAGVLDITDEDIKPPGVDDIEGLGVPRKEEETS